MPGKGRNQAILMTYTPMGMRAKGESRAQAVAGAEQTIMNEEAKGDIASKHTRADRHALGHGPDNEWAPQDGGYGGLTHWGVVKHEFGDWLPSPWTLLGALIDEMHGSWPSVGGGSSHAPPGGGFHPDWRPQCIGCFVPPGYSPIRPQPMPDPSQIHRGAQ